MAYNGTNPVSVGDETLKSHYDRVFDNTVANKSRLDAMDLTADRLWLLNVGNTLADVSISTTDDYNGIWCVGDEMMICGISGANGIIKYSSNRGRSIGSNVNVTGMSACYDVVSNSDGSQWIVVGFPTGTNGIAYSSDSGSTWTGASSGSTTMGAVCYSGSVYVAVGSSGAIYSSTNGTSWTARTADGTPANITFLDVCWSSALSLFIAVGVDTTGGTYAEIQTSSDGTTWTARTAAGGPTGETLLSVAQVNFGSSTYIIAGGSNGELQYSSDGTTWTRHTDYGFSGSVDAIVAMPTGAVIVANNTSYNTLLSTSILTRARPLPSGITSTAPGCGAYSANCGLMIVGYNGGIAQSYPYIITGL